MGKNKLTVEEIRAALEDGTPEDHIAAHEATIGHLADMLNEFPTGMGELLGHDLYRVIEYITNGRPLGKDGDEW